MAGNIGWGQQAQQMNMGQPAGGNSNVVFVNDDTEAMNYPIGPGYTTALINANDPNNGKLFVRSAESNGMPKPVRIFSIKEITPKGENPDAVTREEFDELNQKIGTLSGQFAQVLASLQQITMAQPVQPAQPAQVATPASMSKGGKKQS